MAALKELLQPKTSGETGRSLTAAPDIDALMKRASEGTSWPSAAGQRATQPRRDPAMAFDLLDRVAEALDALMGRCEALEAKMQADLERAEAEAAAQDELIAQWKNFGTGMKSQAEETDRQLQAMKARAEAAEARAAGAEARAIALKQASEAASQRAAVAENLAKEFHDKVVATFGSGSRTQTALRLVTEDLEQGSGVA